MRLGWLSGFVFFLVLFVNGQTVFGEELSSTSTLECPKCEAFFTAVLAALGSNATREDLDAAMVAECKKLPPGEEETACLEFVNWVVGELPALEGYFDEYEPVGLCSILSLCLVHCCNGSPLGTPQQIMLAPTNNAPAEMAITWISSYISNTGNQAKGANPAVKWWSINSPSTIHQANATNYTYTEGGWRGQINTAVMTGLIGGRVGYAYQVGDSFLNVWSQVFEFQSWLNPGSPGSYAMIADMGLVNSNGTVSGFLALAQSKQIDFLAGYGDLSYADGYQLWWDEQGRRLEPLTATMPYLVTPGNHEIPWNFLALRNRFTMPSPGWYSGKAKYYSVNWGLAHLVFLDSETDVDSPNFTRDQLNWLLQDLAQANTPTNRQQYPWIIVGFHRPLYCSDMSNVNCREFATYLRSEIEDILFKNKVDLVLYGHVHTYERMWPTYQNQPVSFNYSSPQAPVYVLCGSAGNPEGNTDNFSPQTPPHNWAVSHSPAFGYGVVQISDPSTLIWQFFGGPNTGPVQLVDSFTITK